MASYWYITFLLSSLVLSVCCSADTEESRNERLISTFQVVRFPNDACTGSNSKNGTCYTSQECSSKSGTSSGSCADGFGVCCTFAITTCGATSSENLTYWTTPTELPVGICSLNICPVSEDICSLRLDFTTFLITGPNTISSPTARRRLGQPYPHNEDPIAANGLQGDAFTTNCLVDNFYATSPSPSSTPPSVCGTLTGQHMYVEADIDRCNMLQFSIMDPTVVGTITRGVGTAATRNWDITVSHIECSSLTVPPVGCTKYWWGSGRATLQNYNFQTTVAAGNIHLGMQHERMCIRRERGNCIGCFWAEPNDFALSWNVETGINHAATGGCCGYITIEGLTEAFTAAEFGIGRMDGENSQYGWDCVIIPGAFIPVSDEDGSNIAIQTTAIIQQALTASPTGAIYPVASGPQICGSLAGLGVGKADLNVMAIANDIVYGTAIEQTICTRNTPFTLEFMSDDLEGNGGVAEGESEYSEPTQKFNQGFNILHTQLSCS